MHYRYLTLEQRENLERLLRAGAPGERDHHQDGHPPHAPEASRCPPHLRSHDDARLKWSDRLVG